jgi:ubiquinone biosynthesis protein UbiJ
LIDNIAKILNDVIENDPTLQMELSQIPNVVIVINIIGIRNNIWLELNDGIISVPYDLPENYTEVKASLFTFISCVRNIMQDKALPSGININGDAAVVTKLLQVLHKSDIDIEQYLSGSIGDISAATIFGAINIGSKFISKAKSNTEENIKDFFEDEVMLIPNRDEFNSFSNDVANLRDAVERLEAKLNFLQEKE